MQSQRQNTKITIYAKSPIAGKVKTRLAHGSNSRFATNAYKALLKHMVQQLAGTPGITIQCSPNLRHGYTRTLARQYSIELEKQPRGDLGQRMSKTVRQGLEQAQQVIIMGADCPTLSTQSLNFHNRNMVFPALDGGYVLVACDHYQPKLFQHITWSSSHVLRQTKRQARRSAISLHIGPTMNDIDHIRDWKKARRHKHVGPLWRQNTSL